MKIKRLILGAAFTLILTPVANTLAINTQDFYFADFTADYYLTKLEDGTSNLHVKEVLTAVFPEIDQNHGITRTIPYTNQDGGNRTIENKDALNLKVLRNGKSENINKIVDNNGYYTVYIGSASEYVHGEQIYTLEYDYTDVITEFDERGNNVSGIDGAKKILQELYWDTNGTAWSQRFNRVTANLHTTPEIYKNMDTETWCYVGKYGDQGNERCAITSIEDGFSFTTDNLEKGENLTFVVEFQPDTFVVIIEKNYILVMLLIAEVLLCVSVVLLKYLKWRKNTKPKYDLYKSLFTTPQYLPPEDKDVHVAEGEQIYMKRTSSSYVATLLELAVDKKITIKKIDGEKKYDWVVVLNVEPEDLSEPQKQMMNILSGDGELGKGSEIPVEKHTPTSYLASYARSYRSSAIANLERRGYLTKISDTNKVGIVTILIVLTMIFASMVPSIIAHMMFSVTGLILPDEKIILVGLDTLPIIMAIVLIVTIIMLVIFSKQSSKYKKYTEDGIKLVKYLEGLGLYIKMAEADRLKFLQSVEGADISEAGIVRLYEKLLPWASLFGEEKSWAKEMEKYYKIDNIDNVLDFNVVNGIVAANIAHDITRAISSSISYTPPSSSSGGWNSGGSGGSWSSSSSGGGSFSGSSSGGGFSGGGGGGGGGGGW